MNSIKYLIKTSQHPIYNFNWVTNLPTKESPMVFNVSKLVM